jgi:hypothetical protein
VLIGENLLTSFGDAIYFLVSLAVEPPVAAEFWLLGEFSFDFDPCFTNFS